MGIAVTYWEALEVAGQIVDELYRRTGGFCLRDMIQGGCGFLEGKGGKEEVC